MNRIKTRTDFLCARSSFLTGIGSVLNIRGDFFDYNRSEDADAIAISEDWRAVGRDIQDALDKARVEFGPVPQE